MSKSADTEKKNYIYIKRFLCFSYIIFVALLLFSAVLPLIADILSEKEISLGDWGAFIILVFAETLAFIIIMSVISNRLYNKRVIPLLNVKCDPQSFTEANMQFIRGKSNKASAAITNSNIALGEFYMGNAEKAISIMNSIIYSDAFSKSNKLVKAHCLINLVVYMMESDPDGNIESIDRIMNEIHGLCADIQPTRMSAMKLDKRIESIDRTYAYIKGNSEGYEAYLIKSFNEEDYSNNIFGRVNVAFSLVEYYKRAGNAQEMIKYADFVIANGNKLYFVPIASEWKRQAEIKTEQ